MISTEPRRGRRPGRAIGLALVLAVLLPASLHAMEETLLDSPDVERPAEPRWLRTELYFAVAREGAFTDDRVSAWRNFLDEAVTPRFPDGLTVLDAYGQWRGEASGEVGRLVSKVLVILHPDTDVARARIEAVRDDWKARTGAQSVLRATQPADVSF